MTAKPRDEDAWDWPRILAAVHRAGWTVTGLAQLHGREPSGFRAVKNRTNRLAQEAISEAIGVPPQILWPNRYTGRKSRILSSENEALIASQKQARAMKAAA